MQAEVSSLNMLFEPERPFMCPVGGAKVSDKMGMLAPLIDRIHHLSPGGGASLEYVQGLELPGVASLERPNS